MRLIHLKRCSHNHKALSYGSESTRLHCIDLSTYLRDIQYLTIGLQILPIDTRQQLRHIFTQPMGGVSKQQGRDLCSLHRVEQMTTWCNWLAMSLISLGTLAFEISAPNTGLLLSRHLGKGIAKTLQTTYV